MFRPFTVWINCSSNLKIFDNSWPSASNFKSFSRSLELFFLTVGQNNFSNKIPFPSQQNLSSQVFHLKLFWPRHPTKVSKEPISLQFFASCLPLKNFLRDILRFMTTLVKSYLHYWHYASLATFKSGHFSSLFFRKEV